MERHQPGNTKVRDSWDSRPGEEYSLPTTTYRRLGRQYSRWMYRLRAGVFQRVAKGLPLRWPEARVLDVGSGSGFYVDQWHRLGVPKVAGADLTEVTVRQLEQRFPGDDFVQFDLCKPLPAYVTRLSAPRSAESEARVAVPGFDAVSAMDVLSRIVDATQYEQALRNIASLLKPGGWLLWSDYFLRRRTERVSHQPGRPLRESEAAVRAAGFDIVDRRPMFVVMNYPADAQSKLARWGWTAMAAGAALAEPLVWIVGAILYPVERQLTRVVKESPSTEIMVCRRA